MEQATIRANSERAKEALQRIHGKYGKRRAEKLAYKMAVKEKWQDKKKSILKFEVRKRFQTAIRSGDFMTATRNDFEAYGVPESEYELETK